jgi:hypothetical protein
MSLNFSENEEVEGKSEKLINSREIIKERCAVFGKILWNKKEGEKVGKASRAIPKLISSQLEKLRKQETLKILLE